MKESSEKQIHSHTSHSQSIQGQMEKMIKMIDTSGLTDQMPRNMLNAAKATLNFYETGQQAKSSI